MGRVVPSSHRPVPARRRDPPPRRGRRGRRVAAGLVLAAMAGLPVAGLAWADRSAADRVPEGVRIGGVDVGGLKSSAAVERLSRSIGAPAGRAVRISVDGETSVLTARRAGVSLDLKRAVDRAVRRGREGSFLARGWREISGAELRASEPVTIRVDRRAVRRFVDAIAADVAVPAQEAAFSIGVEHVGVTESHPGRRLADPAGLTHRLVRSLRSVRSSRRLRTGTETVRPAVTEDSLWQAHPTVVTVSHDAKLARVFQRGSVVKTYRVAVGDPEYPTPEGQFSIQTKQIDPVWNVPDSEWAGALAGTTIPGGDPRNPLRARWIGFNGSVGFHGTADLASLGRAASHGCVRMDPTDVKDLFERVDVGTTVFVGA